MKEKQLLKALQDVRDEFVEESFLDSGNLMVQKCERTPLFSDDSVEQEYEEKVLGSDKYIKLKNRRQNVEKKLIFCRIIAVAAICVIMLFVITVPDIKKEAQFSAQTIGDSNIVLENKEELQTKNPWTETKEIEKLPVYKNLAYVSPAGTPAYFSREELVEKAERTAEKLGTKLIKWNFSEVMEESVHSDVYKICAETEVAEICIYGNGSIEILFYEGIDLPEEYRFSDENTAREAEALVQYLLEMENELLELEHPTADCQISYDLQGNRSIYYTAFGRKENEQELLGYCFQRVTFIGDERGNLKRIYYGDVRAAAEYLGEYEIISVDDAKRRFAAGEYQYIGLSSAMHEGMTEEHIAKVELVYLTGSVYEYYEPYYCFYVAAEGNGLITYERYYVSALTDEERMLFSKEDERGEMKLSRWEML